MGTISSARAVNRMVGIGGHDHALNEQQRLVEQPKTPLL